MKAAGHADHTDHTKGTLLMVAVVLIWGGFLPVSKSALAVLDPYWLTSLRFGIAALAFLGILAWREGLGALKPSGGEGRAFLFGAIGFAGFGICTFEGLRLTRPEIGGMILALGPVITVLWQWGRGGQRPDRFTLIAIAAALAGEALVITNGDLARLTGGDALGNLFVFIATLLWVTYTFGGQQFPGWSPFRYTAMSCSLGWLAIAAATAVATALGHSHPPEPMRMLDIWPQLAFVVLLVSVFGILFWNMAVAKIGPLTAGLFANFTPIITYAIALFQGRIPGRVELAGVALVLGALVANNLHQRARLTRRP